LTQRLAQDGVGFFNQLLKAHQVAADLRLPGGKGHVEKVRDGFDRAQLRTLVDSLRNKWKTAVVVLAAADDSDIAIVSGVTKDLTAKVQAGKLVQQIALGTGGKGGGRPDMAEGGGKNVSALAAELDRVYKTVEEKL